MAQAKRPARLVRYGDLDFIPRAQGGDQAQLAEICGESDGSELCSGLVRLTKARLEWTVKYDEVLFVLEGAIKVTTPQGVFETGPHDAIWLPDGTELIYEAESALVFYALHPANWAQAE